MHRKEFLVGITNEQERSHLVKVFWAIYVLDRRLSFGTGMPITLRDEDIDPGWPEPVDSPANCDHLLMSTNSEPGHGLPIPEPHDWLRQAGIQDLEAPERS